MAAATITPAIANNTSGARSKQKKAKPQRSWTGWMFVGPFMVVFLAMVGAPIIYAIYLSLFKEQLVGGNQFVGFENYLTLFSDDQFWDGFWRVVRIFIIQVPIMLGLGLLAALAIDSNRLRGRGTFRITLFLPYAVPGVVAVLIWGFIYGDQFGLSASFNDFVGSHVLKPLSSSWMTWSIGNILTWSFMGYNMLIMYSGLKTIPTELYEAAEIDGASRFQEAWYIKIPAIKGQILISFMFSIIGTFQLFNEPNLLKPLASNVITSYYTPNLYAYNLSMNGNQYNYSATVAIAMGVITAIIAYATQARSQKQEGN